MKMAEENEITVTKGLTIERLRPKRKKSLKLAFSYILNGGKDYEDKKSV